MQAAPSVLLLLGEATKVIPAPASLRERGGNFSFVASRLMSSCLLARAKLRHESKNPVLLHIPDFLLRLYRHFLFAAVLFLVFAPGYSWASGNAKSKQEPLIKISEADSRSFETALSCLVKQANVALICEDSPLRPDIDKSTSAEVSLQIARLTEGLPLTEAINTVAGLYDYEAVPLGTRVFALKKRFSQDEDLPYVSSAEAIHSLDALLRSTRTFATPPLIVCLRSLLLSLNSAQRQRAKESITLENLRPDQQALATQFAYSFQFAAFEDVDTTWHRMRGCRNETTFFVYQSYHGLTVPFYRGHITSTPGERYAVGVSYWLPPQASGATLFVPPTDQVDSKGNLSETAQEPTSPDFIGNVGQSFRTVPTQTLGAIIEQENQRKEDGVLTVHTEIEAGLGEKPVFLTGEQYSSSGEIRTAIATIYGLDQKLITSNTTKTIVRLCMPSAARIFDPDQVKVVVERLLPAPFLRAAQAAKRRKQAADKKLGKTVPSYKPLAGLDGIYITAVHRLRSIIEPQMHKQSQISVGQSGNEALRLLDLTNLLILFSSAHFHELMAPVVGIVRHKDKAEFTLLPEPDGRSVKYRIQYQGQGKDDPGCSVAGSVLYGTQFPLLPSENSMPQSLITPLAPPEKSPFGFPFNP